MELEIKMGNGIVRKRTYTDRKANRDTEGLGSRQEGWQTGINTGNQIVRVADRHRYRQLDRKAGRLDHKQTGLGE